MKTIELSFVICWSNLSQLTDILLEIYHEALILDLQSQKGDQSWIRTRAIGSEKMLNCTELVFSWGLFDNYFGMLLRISSVF